MKTKLNTIVELSLLGLFILALIGLSVLSFCEASDVEDKITAAFYFAVAVAMIALTVYLKTNKSKPRTKTHHIRS